MAHGQMTRIPFAGHLHHHPLLLRISKPLQFFSSMAANSTKTQMENGSINLANYPVPLSPPPPAISKNMELNRALTASSKSSLFSLSKNDVLFQDEWLIAVNKPQGIYCETLLSAVQNLMKSDDDQGEQANITELHLSNRLDRDTSGVTVITKSHKVAAKLVKAFTDHMVKKTYIAFCIGTIPKWQTITIKSGHGRSRHGAWRVYAMADVGRTLPGGSYIRDMETLFEVLSANGQGCSPESSGLQKHKEVVVEEKSDIECNAERAELLVKAYPRSGRTHQIRLHCQYLGIPIRGDVKYEGECEWKGKIYEGHELHAESLSFEHPITGQHVLIKAPYPIWARKALGQLSS